MIRSTRSRLFICCSTLLALLLWPPALLALNPSLEINQYAHTAWLVRDGFPKGNIRSIAQSPDGYLWLGTEFGLVRFDGSKDVAWTPPTGQRLPSNNIRSLVAARDGTLWIGTLEGLASWKNGKLTEYPQLAKHNVYSLLEDRDGTIWAGTFALPTARLCQIRSGAVTCYGQNGSLGQWVESLYEDSRGRVWAGAMTGVWRCKPGPPERSSFLRSIDTSQALVDDDNRSGLIAIAGDVIWQTGDSAPRKYPLQGSRGPLTPLHMLRDREGGLWIGTLQRGLVHVYRGRTDVFPERDGLSGDDVLSLFEDREGNIWVSTSNGLDRFRGFVANSISVKQGLSSPSSMAVLAARDGSVWTSTLDGLNRWNQGDVTIYRAHAPQPAERLLDDGARAHPIREVIDAGLPDNEPGSLFQDEGGRIWVSSVHGISRFQNGHFTRLPALPGGWVNAMAADSSDSLWIAYQNQGLYRLLQDKVVEQIPWTKLGHTVAASMVVDRTRGGLWLGFFDGGVVYFDGHQLRASYGAKDGLGEGRVMDLRLDPDGTLWASTQGGLSRIKDGRVMTLSSANGLPCDGVHWTVEDSARFFWLYTTCGLVRVAASQLQAWASHASMKIDHTVFDSSDGVRTKALLTGYTPRVSTSADGKIWFSHFETISVIDPQHLPFNDVPPPVHVEQITADGKIYDPNRDRRLPSLVRNLSIDYTALSFVAPEKVHFRYRLEGQDPDWREVINDRKVQYSNLAPGSYRFRVAACNNSGVWNETGAAIDFSIAAAYYQTNWFRALCGIAVLGLLWAAYRFRVGQLQREFNRLREVIETIPVMAWTALADGSNAYVNRRWAEYTGLSAEQTAGSGWTTAVHPDDLQQYVEKWRASVATGRPFECEARFRCAATREYRWLLARSVPLRDKHGNTVRWYAVLTDIEDRKRAEEERQRVLELETELAHINRVSMMGELTASIAHEVNQPLAAVVNNGGACLRWLNRDVPDLEEARETIRRIIRDGKRAGEVITRIRALTRKTETAREKLDLNETVREVLPLVGDEAKRNGVTIRTQFAENLAPVLVDRVQLQQVALNLLLNAMEAMSKTDNPARDLVITTGNIDEQQVVVTVKDSGVGLDPDAATKIFDAFYTTKPGGMGMGLSLSRSIVQRHGGRLWATANEGPGTTFHFTLPKFQERTSHAGIGAV